MKILHFNYQLHSFAPILRSLELAKAAADAGHDVALCYLNPKFRPPEWYYGLIAEYESPRLRVLCPPRRPAPSPASASAAAPAPASGAVSGAATATPGARDGKEWKPSLRAVYRDFAASLRHVPGELRLIDRFRPDVLLARADATLSVNVSARIRSLPLVFETDGPVEELDLYWGLDSRRLRALDTWRARQADALLYISEPCRELWLRKGIPAETLFYAPNAAHPDRFRPLPPGERRSLRARYGLEGAKVIGFSGILRPWHGVDNLLEAVLPLFPEDPSIRVLFIGSEYDAAALDRCRVPEDVRRGRLVFTGRVPYAGMGEMIDMVDCLALPYSHADFFYFSPMKLFEGMCLGKILVAPCMGQIAEMLGDLDSPVLYPAREGVAALRAALREGLRRGVSAGDGKMAGADARARIEQGHSWAHRGKAVSEACAFAVGRSRRKTDSRGESRPVRRMDERLSARP